MEEVVGILGFGLGASLGAGVVRAVGGGLRPLLRETLKAGITVGEGARSAMARAGDAVASATAEMREGWEDLRAEAMAERAAAREQTPPGTEPRKIEIVKH